MKRAAKWARRLPLFLLILGVLNTPSFSLPVGTPVVITGDEECEVSVDGESIGTVAAGEIKKISLVSGEHLVSASCPGGRRWKDTVTVGKDQKVVTIASASSATSPSASGPSADAEDVTIGSGCFLLFDQEKLVPAGRWRVGGVIKNGPCDKGGIRPGGIVLSLGGKKAKDLSPDDLEKLDGGPAGTKLTWEVVDREGEIKKVVLVQIAYPKSGSVEVMQPDGQSVRTVPYDGYDSMIQAFRSSLLDSSSTAPAATVSTPSPTPSTARRCVGKATSCWLRPAGTCTSGRGCVPSGNCLGFAGSCFGKSEFTCATTPGCYWMSFSKTCSGMGPTCAGKTEYTCAATPGCNWVSSCAGTATPCALLGETDCFSQPGCNWQ